MQSIQRGTWKEKMGKVSIKRARNKQLHVSSHLLISKDKRSSDHQEPINPKNSLAKVESLHSLSDIFHLSRKNDKMIMTKSISIPNSRKELG